jgi:SAM-dependent methyltransferase
MSKIFISYSFKPIKEREEITNAIISIVKKAIKECKWEFCDPMDEIDSTNEGVKKKVEEAMRESDAIIAEGSLLIPNVMFECGFMKSQEKPILYLIDKSIHENNDYNHYFKLIDITKSNKISADFGDIEYYQYDGKRILETDYQSELFKELKKIIQTKFQSHMTIGRVMLNNSFNSLHDKLNKMIKINNQKVFIENDEQPFLAFLSGWVNQLSGELLHGENIFKLDIDYYERCLSEFTENSRKDILAIADLTDDAETFWQNYPDTKNTMVHERIFLFDVQKCFNLGEISKIFEILKSQAAHYDIKVGFKNFSLKIPPHNHFHNALHSMNCIIIKPNMVGRYIILNRQINKNRTMLQFVFDKHETNLHLNEYNTLSDKTIAFERKWRDNNVMIEELFKKYEIGKWKKDWNVKAKERDDSYFEWYEGHIRAWIKDYDDLIKTAIQAVFRIKSKFNNNEKFNVLEIGFGSGILSKVLIEDEEIDYLGIDPALKKWEKLLNQNFGNRWVSIKDKFIEGAAWDPIPQTVMKNKPFNLICGSLVLHDFYEDDKSARKAFSNMLTFVDSKNMLKENGALIFADIFIGENTENKLDLINSWKKHLTDTGKFSTSDYNIFKDSNKEMFENLSEEEIKLIANSHSYDANFSVWAEKHSTDNPFKILTLEKRNKTTLLI